MIVADVYVFVNKLNVQKVMLQYAGYEKVFSTPVVILGSFRGQHVVRQLLLEKGTLIWKG